MTAVGEQGLPSFVPDDGQAAGRGDWGGPAGDGLGGETGDEGVARQAESFRQLLGGGQKESQPDAPPPPPSTPFGRENPFSLAGRLSTLRASGPEAGESPAESEPISGADALAGGLLAPGELILSRLVSSAVAPAARSVDRGEPALDEIVQQLAARLLVSDSGGAVGGEVRILLKESVLAGTEIRIRRDQGEIQVIFLTASADAEQFLIEQRFSLQTLLGERLRDSVRVSVERDERERQRGQRQSDEQSQGETEDERREEG